MNIINDNLWAHNLPQIVEAQLHGKLPFLASIHFYSWQITNQVYNS